MFDMLNMNYLFPVYRKYINNKSYFKVFDSDSFEEIQVLGSNYWIYQFQAKILPDRYFIKDLIEMEGERWVEISAEAYNDFKNKCQQDFNKRN